jgi:diguanylate cyclase (GGDEF)-like protein
MTTTDALKQQDLASNREAAAPFWAVALILTLALIVAYPPTHALGPVAGWSIAGGFAVLTVAYIVRLAKARHDFQEREVLAAAVGAVVAVAVDQWLAGGTHAPYHLIFTLNVLGAAAALEQRARVTYLGALAAALAAPLIYQAWDWRTAVAAAVFFVLLVMESALLGEFAARLRAQQVALFHAEREASRRALTDELTGLPNRRALMEELTVRTAGSQPLTIAFLDLDGFKHYNDQLGHEAGDQLLARLGGALTIGIAPHGRAFRLGGDEFCVLVDGAPAAANATIDAAVQALTELTPSTPPIRPSCGVVNFPGEAPDASTALRLADHRMYADKRSRKALRQAS